MPSVLQADWSWKQDQYDHAGGLLQLANIIPVEDAVRYLKDMIEKMYGKKGQKVVDMNKKR